MMETKMATWVDVTVPIRNGMTRWPGNPAVQIEQTEETLQGVVCRVSRLSLGVHTGTHFDAPNHFDVPGGGVEALPLAGVIGVARVLAVGGPRIDVAALEPYDVQPGERVLFKTSNSDRCWSTEQFVPDYVYVTREAGRHLATRRVRLVGIDYLSVGGPDDGAATHRELFEAGVCILEGLDLRRVGPGTYDLIALPLLIPGSDGAPARVLLSARE
jgi:arylformamidase